MIGSLISFLASRTILSSFVHRLVANDSRFAALSLVLKHDGLLLLVMIRLCPLPYSLSNGAMSTIRTVSPLMFALATAIASPKLLIHVFIGGRLAAIAGSEGKKMDIGTRVINYASIAGGMLFGVVTGYLIYQRTVSRARQLENEERTKVAQRARSHPHPDTFSDEAMEEHERLTGMGNDDIDFLDPEAGEIWYRDESDYENDAEAFEYGDGARDQSISLSTQRSSS